MILINFGRSYKKQALKSILNVSIQLIENSSTSISWVIVNTLLLCHFKGTAQLGGFSSKLLHVWGRFSPPCIYITGGSFSQLFPCLSLIDPHFIQMSSSSLDG